MQSNNGAVEILVCLGSSCFSRGNSENLTILKEYAQNYDRRISVRLTGSLCQDQCENGPNLKIGGELHHCVTAANLAELLDQLTQPSQRTHGQA
jgi:NADH:ubiquinone oxidoreductase subunit E